MKEFQAILTAFDDWLWGNWLLFVLLGVGILYTVITGGIQIRRFGYIIRKTVWEPIPSDVILLMPCFVLMYSFYIIPQFPNLEKGICNDSQ